MKKTVLITGASRGIGAACAKEFAKNGYSVAINYFKSYDKALYLLNEIKQIGGVADIFYGDVSQKDDVDRIYTELKEKLGLPGVLINNAGIAYQQLFTSTSLSDWHNIFKINVDSMFLCCKKFLPYMIQKKWGRVINISSVWGVVGGSCEVAYSSSKAAVIGFSKALAKEMALSNITVNCIAPGVINTDMNKNLTIDDLNALKEEIPCGKIGRGIDIAKAALFLADESSDYITGQVLNVGGGFMC